MPKITIESILNMIESLSPLEQDQLKVALLSEKSKLTDMENLVSSERFFGGVVCPLCGCVENIVRNGHDSNGKQRYFCKACKKTFLATTNSITTGSRKDLGIWKKYMECLINKMPYRKAAIICGIHRNTAFKWRHKILDALQAVANKTRLEGIIEADETFFRVSYKGNHRSSPFTIPRESRRRGGANSVRGVSKELVCVPCAVDRSGNSFSKIATLGRIKTIDLQHAYNGKIRDKATMCTDKMNSYVRFTTSNDIKLVQLKTGKTKKGIYHIQHINAYHSKLKGFIRIFKGVSTKYLNNYLLWNNLINVNDGSMLEKIDFLLKNSTATYITVKFKDLSKRPAIPVLS